MTPIPSDASERPTVAVIGAGFSGLLTSLRLLSEPAGPNVRLVEKRGAFGRGAAYSTLDPEHLLNVRASNMSALPEDPAHFVRWLAERGYTGTEGLFVRRNLYGDYLQSMIQTAVEAAPAGRFLLEPDAATALEPEGGGWRVRLAMGREFLADAVVIAVGNLPPGAPPGFGQASVDHPAYCADPWSLKLETLPNDGRAVLIGTGLSMIDVALQLAKARPGLKTTAISRRGLLPRRHLDAGPQPAGRDDAPAGLTVRALAADLRRRSADQDWRAVIDGVRPHVHAVWTAWPTQERRRFLRHARPWWDVHRHRLAPPVAAKLDHLLGCGALRIEAGRIHTVEPSGERLRLVFAPRGRREPQAIEADLIVNCAGPNGDPTRASDPLLTSLIERGCIRPDACRIGLDADPEGRLKSADGETRQGLYAIGPIMRGVLWEITSVPDIRVQAAAAARTVLADLAQA